jgi:energy-converting hydrogenase A subunit R
MKLFPGGERVFEVVSRYDDLLTLEKREGYQPGDTLALIVPFLLRHDITEEDISRVSQRAKLTPGALELISQLHSQDWKVFCISTSYEQHARAITRKLGISEDRVACTIFPLNHYRQLLHRDDLSLVERVEGILPTLQPMADDQEIKELLDRFYWEELPLVPLGKIVGEVKPMGGERKVEALKRFATEYNQSLSHFLVVGDSITDAAMLEAVRRAGGLSIAFNANEYALPYATLSLASTHLSDLAAVCQTWAEGGKGEVEELIRRKEGEGGKGDREFFHWLVNREDLQPVLQIHRRLRRLVRQEAAALG